MIGTIGLVQAVEDQAGDLALVGWFATFEVGDERLWEPDPDRVHPPAERYESSISTRVETDAAGLDLSVHDVERVMAWTLTTEPVWVESFPYIRLRYRVSGKGAKLGLRLEDDATGPVTPGADNPENPLAGDGLLRVDLEAKSGQLQTRVLRLIGGEKNLFGSNRVSRIGFDLQAGDGPASARIEEIVFLLRDPSGPERADVDLPPLALKPDASEASSLKLGTSVAWSAWPLSGDFNGNLSDVADALGCRKVVDKPGKLDWEGVPFELDSQGRVKGTRVMQRESIEQYMNARGTELHLLLAAQLCGTDEYWVYKPRKRIVAPDRIVIRVNYADRSKQDSIPFHRRSAEHGLLPGLHAYIVPLHEDRTIQSIEVIEGMSFGQVFLLATTLRTQGRTEGVDPIKAKPNPVFAEVPPLDDIPVISSGDGDFRVFLSPSFQVRLNPHDFWRLDRFTPRCLTPATQEFDGIRLFAVKVGEETLTDWEAPPEEFGPWKSVNSPDSEENSFTVSMQAVGKNSQGRKVVEIECTLTVDGRGELSYEGLVKPLHPDLDSMKVYAPYVEPMQLSERVEDDIYFVPSRSALLSSDPVDFREHYCGSMPMQFMDVSSPERGGGIGILVEDTSLIRKAFALKKDDKGTSFSVEYNLGQVSMAEGQRIPRTVIYPHTGDWHTLYERYLEWVNTWREPHSESRTWCREVINCRRDYPVGGTGYLYGLHEEAYTPEILLAESERCLGGTKMIDISGWAMSEKTGRVGDYRKYELGGLEAIHNLIAEAHARGVRVGLYLEGYLIDKRCEFGLKYRKEWGLIDKNGKPRMWTGDMEFFACPGVETWRHAFADQLAAVAKETDADAFYIDQFGFGDDNKRCWSDAHDHPVGSNPLETETGFLRTVREALDKVDPSKAIYTEQFPVDTMTPWVDLAFSYAMTKKFFPHHATRMALMRYAFPEIRPIELYIAGIRPIAGAADLPKLCFFHAQAHWFKGRASSWLGEGGREFVRRAHKVSTTYKDAFASDDCKPLVSTLCADLYANRFATEDTIVYTVYHAGPNTLEADWLALDAPEGWVWSDAFSQSPVELIQRDGKAIYRSTLDPHEVTCLVAKPR